MFAVIGGTGLSELQNFAIVTEETIQTPYGEAFVQQGRYASTEVAFLPRHGAGHRVLPHDINYRANIWALQQCQVTDIIAVNAVGGINPAFATASLVLPHQLIDYTWGRESSFAKPGEIRHIDFTYPFSEKIRSLLIEAGYMAGVELHSQAVYGVTQGPRLETAAEIDRLERDGCDIVGMTAMPEAVLAKELGMHYACLSLVVNPAAGRSQQEISMAQIESALEEGMVNVKRLLTGLFTVPA